MSTTARQHTRNGFTIVEILIVVVVIGILAAIVIVSYSSVQKKAQDTSVLSDLEATSGLVESYRQNPNNADEFPKDFATLATLGIKVNKNAYMTTNSVNFVFCFNNSADATVRYKTYALIAESKSGNIFMMTEDGFKTYPLGASLGTSLGLASSGMYSPNTWQTWVASN